MTLKLIANALEPLILDLTYIFLLEMSVGLERMAKSLMPILGRFNKIKIPLSPGKGINL